MKPIINCKQQKGKSETNVNWKRLSIGLFTALLLLSSLLVYVYSQTVQPTTPLYLSGGQYPNAVAFTVWKEGTSYFAKTSNGYIQYSGTNATEVIQDAIDTTPVAQTTQLLDGVFEIDAPLQLRNGTRFKGSGKARTTLRQTNLTANTIEGLLVWQTAVEDMTIDKSCYFAEGGEAIYLYNCSAFTYLQDLPPNQTSWIGYGTYLKNLIILNQINGIHIDNCKWVYMEDLDIYDIGSPTQPGNAVWIDDGTDFWLNRVWCAHHDFWNSTYGNGTRLFTIESVGVRISNGGGFYLTDVSVLGAYYSKGFYVSAESSDKIYWGFFTRCLADTVGGNGFEIAADNQSEVKGFVFTDCWAADCEDNGYYIYGEWGASALGVYGIRFAHCRAITNYVSGFKLSQNIGQLSIIDAEISDNNKNESVVTGHGIDVGNVTGSFTIDGNRIGNYLWRTGHQLYGVYIGDGCDNYDIRNNVFDNDTSGEVYVYASPENGTFYSNRGFRTDNAGNQATCINGTAITHGLAGTPTSVVLTMYGQNYINSTCWYLPPTLYKMDDTTFTICFMIFNAGTITAVGVPDSRTIYWEAVYKP